MTLEQVFKTCRWERKFQSLPQHNDKVIRSFRDPIEASRYLGRNREETKALYRSLHLCSDSIGTTLCVTEGKWEEE